MLEIKEVELEVEDEVCPRIISREEWGARPPVEESSHLPDLLAMLFLHHSAMTECEDQASCEAAAREIQDLHMDNNGWWDIGYRSGDTTVTSHLTDISSFLIGGDGLIYEGRGWNVQGAHTLGFNTVGYGICFLGDFSSHDPTTPAMAAYASLVACALETGKIAVSYQMFGHRQTQPEGGTECPGDSLYSTIQSWPHWVGRGQSGALSLVQIRRDTVL